MAKDRWEKADIVGKLLIGTFGLAATVLIGTSQLRTQEAKSISDIEASLRAEFLENYKFAREDIGDCSKFNTSLDLANVVAQQLAGKPHENPRFSASVERLRSVGPRCGTPQSGNANATALQQSEAATAPDDDAKWFAVVGTFVATPGGLGRAQAWAASVGQATGLCTEIWKTRISGSYAVTLDGATTQGRAVQLAATARRFNSPGDAFTQVNRGWTQKARQCPPASLPAPPEAATAIG